MLGALLWGIGASMALAEENEKAKTKSVEEQLEYAKTIIQDLLDNSDAPVTGASYSSKAVFNAVSAALAQFEQIGGSF